MTETPQTLGFRGQIREILKQEPVTIALVSERTLPKFDSVLTELSAASGMLPMTGNPEETNADWLNSSKALWVFGQKETDFSASENAAGFISVYAPENVAVMNDWLTKRGMRAYDQGAVVEMSSFAKEQPGSVDMELSADKQALAKVFMDDAFKDVRAVTMWETHDTNNVMDAGRIATMKKLGGWPLGSAKYSENETVDSTCFLITRRAFMDALTGLKTGSGRATPPAAA